MGLQWYPKFPGDYARDTAHLTMLEHGAYNLLMDYYYSTAKPLPANEDTNAPTLVGTSNPRLYRICRAVTQEEQKAVDMVIDSFFILIDGEYHQTRADKEIEKRVEISDKRKLARAARGVAKKNNDNKKSTSVPTNEGTSVGTLEHTTTTTTTTTPNKKESIEIPSFIDGDLWIEFVAHKGGSKFTQRSAKMVVKKLTTWHGDGYDVNEILRTTIMNGWKGVFLPKDMKGNNNGKSDADAELARFLDRRTN